MAIQRIAIGPKQAANKQAGVFKIYNLEVKAKVLDLTLLLPIFCNAVTEELVKKLPAGEFLEVMYHNGVIDPEQSAIIRACESRGTTVEAAKVSYRYYGSRRKDVYVNKLVHKFFTTEPSFITLKPRGVRRKMRYFDLSSMNGYELAELNLDRELHLSASQLKRLTEIQYELGLRKVTDVFLETFAAR